MTPEFSFITKPTGRDWRALDTGALLALLARPLPYTVRYTAAGDALVAHAALPLLEGLALRREAWLEDAVRAAALFEVRAAAAPADHGEHLEALRIVAVAMAWTPLEDEEPGLRFAVRGEPDLPPVAVVARDGALVIERPLPLLPARGAAPVVRAAVAHAVLAVNGALRAARVVVRDPEVLTLAVECRLAPGDVDEDEAACLLAGVSRAAPRAAEVFDCLRNPAVAGVYAIAQNLSRPASDRERHEEE